VFITDYIVLYKSVAHRPLYFLQPQEANKHSTLTNESGAVNVARNRRERVYLKSGKSALQMESKLMQQPEGESISSLSHCIFSISSQHPRSWEPIKELEAKAFHHRE
jgi:hypothetical protein